MKSLVAMIFAASLVGGLGARADTNTPSGTVAFPVDTEKQNNTGSEMRLAFSTTLTAKGYAGLRVHFPEFNLGSKSYVRLTALKDGQTQQLDTTNMLNWFQTSAAFNGDSVLLELFVAPGESGIRAVVDSLVTPVLCRKTTPSGPRPNSLSGGDDRVATSDLRIGRTSAGCTAWLISNGAVLSAGHCVPNGAVFMVNVPASNP